MKVFHFSSTFSGTPYLHLALNHHLKRLVHIKKINIYRYLVYHILEALMNRRGCVFISRHCCAHYETTAV